MSFGDKLALVSQTALSGQKFSFDEFYKKILLTYNLGKRYDSLFATIKRMLLEAAEKGVTQVEITIEFDSSRTTRPSSKINLLGISEKGKVYKNEIKATEVNKYFMVHKSFFKREHEYILNNSSYKDIISWNDLLAVLIAFSFVGDIEFILHSNLSTVEKLTFDTNFSDGTEKIKNVLEKYYQQRKENPSLVSSKITAFW